MCTAIEIKSIAARPYSPKKIAGHVGVKRNQQGAALILVVIALPVLFGVTALAVDFAYAYVVRNELQNAADASALAGTGCLHPRTECGNSTNNAPDFTTASSHATTALALNKSESATITSGSINTGYWNVTNTSLGVHAVPGASDFPAVQVRIKKDTGFNGGPVHTFIASIFGVNTVPITSTATAVISSPGTVVQGLLPVVMTQCMYTNYWNSSSNPPQPINDPATGKPYVIKIGSSYHTGACEAGQWTSFSVDANDVPTIRGLITNGNPTALSIGDNTWIQPGTKTTLFSSVNSCSAAGDKTCEYVTIPIVGNITTHAAVPIVAFACLHIDLANGGSGKYIQAEMSTKCPPVNSSGIGPVYGAITPPRLVQ
ncbi:TadE/TadG family type IV pilus assembly protein [Pseudomonas sp. 6D_7.1_Bac1]|uniref:TadE/TadG family type IV pilus assembly protein n=1 Tax=Pseudomonas sp. 6D_7.1_Bac1 TaxID=2971615 RepID=UPI0021C7966E|nr:TadE/TadG family type IV pilus assembly protein [Pseudomonas sp. 6D_7.1_Bac1]MCU1752104.1 Tad domain-containing protein [Pseudomonas sp. 6D_7.1_Bac1]